MELSVIEKTISLLHESFLQLKAEVPMKRIEDLAVMVNHAMTVPSRSYHNPEHVFDLVDSPDPVHALAALFHDIVYYQIDKEFQPQVALLVRPYINEKENDIKISRNIPPGDRLARLTLGVFGLYPGKRVSVFSGLNEWLSALVLARSTADVLPEKLLLEIILCIETTIPFRRTNKNGETCIDLLTGRLSKINAAFGFGMDETTMDSMIQSAVVFANKDTAGFAEKDPGKFLDGTWKLLPETNAALRTKDTYTLREYRTALQKMEKFLVSLDPDTIFRQYKGIPPDSEYDEMVRLAHRNVLLGREYLGIKLLAMAILEALAEATGGDAPISLFMGELGDDNKKMKKLYHFLPEVPETDDKSELARLLKIGRSAESKFDLKNSPTSYFLYNRMGTREIGRCLASARRMFRNETDALEFLECIDRTVLSDIVHACAQMVTTRRDELLEIPVVASCRSCRS